MICPMVISPAAIKELTTNRRRGTLIRACLKFSSVGCDGSRFISVVNSSPDGMNATLTAYKSGSSTNTAITTLPATRAVRFILRRITAFSLAAFCASSSAILPA